MNGIQNLVIRLVLLLWFQANCTAVDIAPQARHPFVVKSIKSDGVSSRGTGFTYSLSGRIATCYHVIHESKNIILRRNKRDVASVSNGTLKLEAIAPEIDLAILRVGNATNHLFQLKPVPTDLRAGTGLTVVGHPNGIENTRFDGRTTHEGLQSGIELARDIFRTNLKILPLDITVGPGMSGAPVVHKNRVIGVLSGSLNEETSRTFSWAIPSNYLLDDERYFRKFNMQSDRWPEVKIIRRFGKSSLGASSASTARGKIPDLFEFGTRLPRFNDLGNKAGWDHSVEQPDLRFDGNFYISFDVQLTKKANRGRIRRVAGLTLIGAGEHADVTCQFEMLDTFSNGANWLVTTASVKERYGSPGGRRRFTIRRKDGWATITADVGFGQGQTQVSPYVLGKFRSSHVFEGLRLHATRSDAGIGNLKYGPLPP